MKLVQVAGEVTELPVEQAPDLAIGLFDVSAVLEAAVEEGRNVFDNLLKFIAWTLPTNGGQSLVLLVAGCPAPPPPVPAPPLSRPIAAPEEDPPSPASPVTIPAFDFRKRRSRDTYCSEMMLSRVMLPVFILSGALLVREESASG